MAELSKPIRELGDVAQRAVTDLLEKLAALAPDPNIVPSAFQPPESGKDRQ